MIVRRATDADATAIAKIHVDAWRAAYGGIVPASFLDSLSIEAREKVWRGISNDAIRRRGSPKTAMKLLAG